jgi:hypothetical protein
MEGLHILTIFCSNSSPPLICLGLGMTPRGSLHFLWIYRKSELGMIVHRQEGIL